MSLSANLREYISAAVAKALNTRLTDKTIYTEHLQVSLPLTNAIGIVALSLLFLSFFGYFIFSRGHLRGNEWEFVKRICCAYMITFVVSVLILLLVEKFPIASDPATAIRRAVLVSFPGCFSATVVDSLK